MGVDYKKKNYILLLNANSDLQRDGRWLWEGPIDVLVFRPRTSNIFFEHSSDSGQCSGTSTQYLKFCA